jgi:guanosine-3',5'-bis(diphosphate) 3'-pyrophosphohydrolase
VTASSVFSKPARELPSIPIQSPGLTKFDDEPNRWVDIRWDIDENNKNRFPGTYPCHCDQCTGYACGGRPGRLPPARSNIQNLTMVRVAADFTEMLIDLQVWDLKHLNQLIAQLKALESVSTVERVYE